MHLAAMGRALNLFTPTGYFNYTKSAQFTYNGCYNFLKRILDCINGSCFPLCDGVTVTGPACQMTSLLNIRGRLTQERRFTAPVRLMCVYSTHTYGKVDDTIPTLTGIDHSNSVQHVDLTSARRKRNHLDLSVQPLCRNPTISTVSISRIDRLCWN